MNAEAHFDMRTAVASYKSAYRLDTLNFLYLHHYGVAISAHDGPVAGFKQSYGIASKDIQRCGEAAQRADLEELLALWRAQRARACVAHHALAIGGPNPATANAMHDVLMQHGLASGYTYRAAALRAAGDAEGAVSLLRRGIQRTVHPRDRILLSVALSDHLRALGRHAEAQRNEREVEAAVRRGGPATRYWYALAKVPALTGDALDHLARDAAGAARANGVAGLCADILHYAGGLHVDRGDQVRAIRLLEEGRLCARQSAPYYSMVIAVKLGRALYKAGEYERAITMLSQAGRLAREQQSSYYVAEALHNLTHTHEARGDLDRARRIADQYVAAAHKLGRSSLRIVSLRDAGIIYWNSAQRVAARSYFERMVGLVTRERQEYHWAAEYYERIGDMPNARSFYRLSLAQPGDSARKFAGLTRVYLALGEVDSAQVTARMHDQYPLQTPEEVPLLPYVQLARGRAADAVHTAARSAAGHATKRNLAGAIAGYVQTATLALLAHQPNEALTAARTAYQFATRSNDKQAAVRALTLQGEAQSRLGDHKSAGVTFSTAIGLADRTAEPLVRAAAYAALGTARVRARHFGAGLVAFDSAAAIRLRVVEKFEDDFDRVRFIAPFAGAFEQSIAAVAKQGDAVMLSHWLQRRKARSRRLIATSLPKIESALARDEVVIDFLVTPEFVGGLLISRDTARVFTASVSGEQLKALITRMHRPVQPQFGRVDFSRARFDYAASRQLYHALIGPVRELLASKRRIYVSPDGRLHMVPFDALVQSGSGESAHMLIDTHEVVYVVSAADAGKRTPPQLGRFALVLGTAPGVEEESAAIRRRIRARVVAPATEARVRDALRSSRIIHFAAHAEANVEQPLLSHLRLERGAGDDGYFHISEISQSRTRAQLVVLTACETVNSRIYGGDGALSIARAFLNAGAGAVLATQWSVGLPAAHFSDRFYAGLQAGKSVSAAAREAKLSMRKNGYANPLIWAPFVLIAGRT